MTADDADRVLSDVSNVVGNLDQEDDQSEENLELIAGVFDQIGSLITDNENFTVSDTVSSIDKV